jgi:hypothetical protein
MNQSISESEFSIIRGGLMDRFLHLLKISSPQNDSALRKIVFFISITWIPLLLISAFEGLLWGENIQIPFIIEFATHIRLLLAIPLLVAAEKIVDARVKISINQFRRSGLIAESGLPKFEIARVKADRMCESVWAEVIILVFIVLNLFFRINANEIGLTTWVFPDIADQNALSFAGYWAAFVSLPIFQFMLLRWIWRWFIWLRLLNLISKSDLRLLPLHPDKSGGLGFLGESPLPFSVFTFVLSIVFSGLLAERVLFFNFILQEHYPLIGAFVLICVFINVIPLLVFVKNLSQARSKGIQEYHALVAHHHKQFEQKWLAQTDKEDILGHPDVSSAADILTVYEAVRSMTIFPFNIKTMMVSVMISLLPLVVVFALQLPVADLLKMLAGILL